MTAEAVSAPAQDESWRGVAAEDIDELDRATGLKLQARSRKLLGSLLRPHRARVALALVQVIGENLTGLLGPVLIATALDTGVPRAVHGDGLVLAWCVVGYLACGLASAGLRYLFMRTSGRIGQDVMLDLRQRLFTHTQALSLSFHESYTSGKIVSRLTSDLDSIEDLLDQSLDGLLSAIFTIVGIGVTMFWLDVPLAALVIVGLGPVLWITRWFYRKSQRAYRNTRGAIATIIVHFVETMNGMRAVQAFSRQARNEQIMAGLNSRFREANREALNVVATFTSTVRLIGNLSLALVIGIGAWRVAHGDLDIGVLAAFTLYLRRFYDPLDDVAMFANAYTAASAGLEKISGVLEERPSVPEPADPAELPEARSRRGGAAGLSGAAAAGEIRFSGVEFRYSPDTPVVLPELDLHIPAGQTVALVGPTGAGKSTVAKLVARFYDPSAGTLELDGVDVRRVPDVRLREAVAMVTQENFLFGGSVADNIGLGRPTATRAEIEAAARAVGAAEFITALPEGYDTDVRKRGGRLSAGQRQMVAFARAFLADPAVLVLDEATSSLDIPTERAVQSALATVLADRTALIIAHRLSTVLIADRVLVIDDGRVVEDGSPEELIGSAGGRFAALHQAWVDSLV